MKFSLNQNKICVMATLSLQCVSIGPAENYYRFEIASIILRHFHAYNNEIFLYVQAVYLFVMFNHAELLK